MTSRHEKLRELAALCGELGPGDGVNPRDERTSHPNRTGDRKTWQLCKQVATALQLALDASEDSRLRSVHIVMVEPAPDAAHLRVVVAPKVDATHELEELMARLEAAHGFLRREVAQAISRRRTPDLSLSCLPAPASPDHEDHSLEEEAP